MKSLWPYRYTKKLHLLKYGLLLLVSARINNKRIAAKWQARACRGVGELLGCSIKVTTIRVMKWKRVIIDCITVDFKNGTLYVMKDIRLDISFGSILAGNPVKSMRAVSIYCERPSSVNEDDNIGQTETANTPFNILKEEFYHFFFTIFHNSMKLLPKEVFIENIEKNLSYNKHNIIRISGLKIRNKSLIMTMTSSYLTDKPVTLRGHVYRRKNKITVDEVEVRDISNSISEDSRTNNFSLDHNVIKGTIQAEYPNLLMFKLWIVNISHPVLRVLDKDFELKNLEMDINLVLSKTSFKTTKNSTITYNGLCLSVFACHYFPELIQISLHGRNISLQQLLKSYNRFIYKPLYDFRFLGELSKLTVIFAMETYSPYKHYFKHEIPWREIGLIDTPRSWPDLNRPFLHKLYDKGKLVRSLFLGKKNDGFMKIEEIPDRVQDIILFTEDPNFYKHNGVDDRFIGHAIVQNILMKKIIRGGSTITMQLVRNLFLGHERTFNRKFEEILISLLIENVFKISKSRILELYLNIIEFGPDIYGIKEACRFYFSKLPSELSVIETLVLSYIIPRPKYFLDAVLSSSRQLKRNLGMRLQFLTEALSERNIISEEEVKGIGRKVNIRGIEMNL